MGKWKPVEQGIHSLRFGDEVDISYIETGDWRAEFLRDNEPKLTVYPTKTLALCCLVPDDEANADVAKWQGFEDTIAELRSQLRETQTRQALDEGVSVPVKVAEAIMALVAHQEASGYSLTATRIRRWLRQQQKGGE